MKSDLSFWLLKKIIYFVEMVVTIQLFLPLGSVLSYQEKSLTHAKFAPSKPPESAKPGLAQTRLSPMTMFMTQLQAKKKSMMTLSNSLLRVVSRVSTPQFWPMVRQEK